MISVIMLCHDRQTILDKTLPLWLAQKDVDFEIVIAVGHTIKLPEDVRIRTIPAIDNKDGVEGLKIRFCKSYNNLVEAAKGDILLITYCDMLVTDDYQLKRMLGRYHDKAMVTDKVFREGKRNFGVFLDIMMVAKSAVQAVGGWCELYDDPTSFGHEDGDLVASMLENGHTFEFIETPEEKAVYHIPHYFPDMTLKINQDRFVKGRRTYFSRHAEGTMALYARQLVGGKVYTG